MNPSLAERAAQPASNDAAVGPALLRAPWRGLDDAALLAHFQGKGTPRGVQYDAVIDPMEIQPARMAGIMLGRFEFNGETHALSDPVDWLHNPSRDVEWHILLHKFYYAVGLSQAWQASGDTSYALRWPNWPKAG